MALLVALGSTLLAAAAARASGATPGVLNFTIAPDGAGNVVVYGSGTVNLSGDSAEGTDNGYSPLMNPSGADLNVGPTSSSFANDVWLNAAGPSSFGTGGPSFATSGTGNFIYFSFDSPSIVFLGVPTTYVSGATLTDSALFSNTTLAGLGLMLGSNSWSWTAGSTTDTLNINVVPEPATWALLAFGSVALLAWRRRSGVARARSEAL